MSETKPNAASAFSSRIDAVLKRRRASVIEVVDAKSAVDLATAQSYSENVFLFVPNLIGEFQHPSQTTTPHNNFPSNASSSSFIIVAACVCACLLQRFFPFPDVKGTVESSSPLSPCTT
jgi:hypothetical protein